MRVRPKASGLLQGAGTRKRNPGGLTSPGLVFAILLACQAGAHATERGIKPGDTQGRASAAPGAGGPPSPPDLNAASPDVRYVADWVAGTGDNAGMPYIIVDKINAMAFLMDAHGRLEAAAPALLGMERGDQSVAGIGDQKLSTIRPHERTTPAGRYVASLGQDLHGQDILWIDYANAIALHRVVKGTPVERRARRLQSATPEDNRISYGCINVPVKFYENFVGPAFTGTSGVVYILPEMTSVREMFKARDASTSSYTPATSSGTAR